MSEEVENTVSISVASDCMLQSLVDDGLELPTIYAILKYAELQVSTKLELDIAAQIQIRSMETQNVQ